MEVTGAGRREYVSYEYKEVIAEQSRLSFLLNGYESFGWELDGNLYEPSGKGRNPHRPAKSVLRLKRNRKLVNRTELTRLQRNFEACVDEIEMLEKSKDSAAITYALIIGLLGTAFMAGSTFAVTARPPQVLLCILLAIPGFIGWILPLFIYRKALEKRTRRVTPLIEEKYDEIDEICEKGNKLLY